MKKSILILIVMVFCLQITGFSQKSSVGFTGGVSVANMRGSVGGKDQKGNSLTGYTFGLIVEAPITDKFSFQPGLHYIQKGKQDNQPTGNSPEKKSTALRYAELQLNFLYNTVSDRTTIFIGVGPAVSINLPSKFVSKIDKTKTDTDVTFGNASENFRGFDIGPNIVGGFRFPGGFLVSLNYTLGVRNLVPGGSGTDEIHNSCFGIRLGLLIDNK